MNKSIFTIGHSDRSMQELMLTLVVNRVYVVADIRSSPYSRHFPDFNREALRSYMKSRGMDYVFLGDLLGGRPDDPSLYDEAGHVLYYELAKHERFLQGIERLEKGEQLGHRICLLCSEGDPSECHRHLLVARVLVERGWSVWHILRDDSVVDSCAIAFQAAIDGDESTWKSIRSVSPRNQQNSSSDYSEAMEFDDSSISD